MVVLVIFELSVAKFIQVSISWTKKNKKKKVPCDFSYEIHLVGGILNKFISYNMI